MDLPQSSPFEELGLKPIHVASLKGDFEAVERLVLEDGNAHQRTAQGETPLILASLMGHVEVVAIPAQHGAKFESCDKFRRNALSYTSENAYSYIRRQVFAQHGFNETAGAKHRRVLIASYLNPAPFRAWKHTNEKTSAAAFHKTTNGVEAFVRCSLVKAPRGIDPRDKTVGYIRNATEIRPLKWAFSGCPRTPLPDNPNLLDSRVWTQAALYRVAPAINFDFKAHYNDQFFQHGTLQEHERGRYFACHVECKLAVWYCFSLLAAVKSMPKPSKTFCANNLRDLLKAELGDGRRAVIEIDQPACESCGCFLKALERVSGIEFEISYRPSLALVPDVVKRRNYLLAHQSALSELTEQQNTFDPGSDDIDEWIGSVEDEPPLLGDEEFVVISNIAPLGTTSRDLPSQGHDSIDDNIVSMSDDDSESGFLEHYPDDRMDKSYHARQARPMHSSNAENILENALDDTETDNEDPVLLAERFSSPPRTPSRISLPMTPVTGFGSAARPIEVPSSPTESLFAARRLRKRLRPGNDENSRWQYLSQETERRAVAQKCREAQMEQSRLESSARKKNKHAELPRQEVIPSRPAISPLQDVDASTPNTSDSHRYGQRQDVVTTLFLSSERIPTVETTPRSSEATGGETSNEEMEDGHAIGPQPAKASYRTPIALGPVVTPTRRISRDESCLVASPNLTEAQAIIRNYAYRGDNPSKSPGPNQAPSAHSSAYFMPKDVN